MNNNRSATRLHIALFVLSATLIAFQLEQMQLLALMQWHHFAYLIISVALLGFGVAGTVIALFKIPLLRNLETVLPLSMIGCSVVMAAALPLFQEIANTFDISLLFVDPVQAVLVIVGQTIYLLVFFLGALPIGLVFVGYSQRIGSLYCANMIGSGVGGILVVLGMFFFTPHLLSILTAILLCSAAFLLISPARIFRVTMTGIPSLLIILMVALHATEIKPSQYKAISRTLDLPQAKLIKADPSPYGLVQEVSAPALRYAPGLSVKYQGVVSPLRGAVFSNGDWFGAVWEDDAIFRSTISALPYFIGTQDKVLVLDAGTGTDLVQAKVFGAKKITAVDPHRKAVHAAADLYGNGPFNILQDDIIHFSFLSSRTWLAFDDDQYDLIILPDVGSFGGESGLLALHEQYLLTRESFSVIWQSLKPEGMIRVSSWIDSPPRNPLRLAATIAEMLENVGVNSLRHLAVIGSWDMVTFVIKRSPLDEDELQSIRSFCHDLQFDPIIMPGQEGVNLSSYHSAGDQDYKSFIEKLLSADQRQDMYKTYPFAIRPVSDNRPFFSQFLRWKSLPMLTGRLGGHTVPFLEMGYVLVLIGFVQMSIAAGVLILLPLVRLHSAGWRTLKQWTLPYFSGLGLGYMFFEIVLIHEMILYLGNPIFAAAIVISGLLIFSGLGSLYSGRSIEDHLNHWRAAGLVAILLLIYLFMLPPMLHLSIGLPFIVKIIFFVVAVAPPSFVMGMPFPLGLKRLAGHSESQAAWAWGINGSVSVVSAGMAAIVAVEFGFSAVMLVAVGGYFMAAVAGYKS